MKIIECGRHVCGEIPVNSNNTRFKKTDFLESGAFNKSENNVEDGSFPDIYASAQQNTEITLENNKLTISGNGSSKATYKTSGGANVSATSYSSLGTIFTVETNAKYSITGITLKGTKNVACTIVLGETKKPALVTLQIGDDKPQSGILEAGKEYTFSIWSYTEFANTNVETLRSANWAVEFNVEENNENPLESLYKSLNQNQKPEGTFTLNSTSVPDSAVLQMVENGFGMQTPVVTNGKLSLSSDQSTLTFTGNSSFFGAINVPVDLIFTAPEGKIALGFSLKFGKPTSLDTIFSILKSSFYSNLMINGLTFSKSLTSSSPVNEPWTITGNANKLEPNSPLKVAAKIFNALPASIPLNGTLVIDTNSHTPNINLGLAKGTALGFSLVNKTWDIPNANLSLLASYDTTINAYKEEILASVEMEVNDKKYTFTTSIPYDAGLVNLSLSADGVISLSNLASLIIWPISGITGETIEQQLPKDIFNNNSPTFGLKELVVSIAPSSLTVTSISFSFGISKGWTIMDAESPGKALKLATLSASLNIVSPFNEKMRNYSVGIQGKLTMGNIELDASVWGPGPDWKMHAKLTSGKSYNPTDIITAFGGTDELPSSNPTTPVSYIEADARPHYNTYSAKYSSTEKWNVFTVGDLDVAFNGFSIMINLNPIGPNTNKYKISLGVIGYLQINQSTITLNGWFSKSNNQITSYLSAQLGTPLALPSLGDLVNAIQSGWGDKLPTSLSSIGSNIVLTDFSMTYSSDGPNTLNIAINTIEGWDGWTLFSTPFNFKLSQAALILNKGTGKDFTGQIAGNFLFGTNGAGVLVTVAFPLGSQYKFSLISNGGLPIPTLGEVVGLISEKLAAALPESVSNIGSNISITVLDIVVEKSEGTSVSSVDFALNQSKEVANDTWYPLGTSSGLGLQNFSIEGNWNKPKGASGTLKGTILISKTGIPLEANLSTQKNTWSVSLDSNSKDVSLPSLGDFISLIDKPFTKFLPEAFSEAGSGMKIETFNLDNKQDVYTANLNILAPLNWAGPEIKDFSYLLINGFEFSASYKNSKWDLGLALTGLLFSEFKLSIQFQYNTGSIIGNVDLINDNHPKGVGIIALCQYFLGEKNPKTWTDTILVTNIAVNITYVSPASISISASIADIDLSVGGKFEDIKLTATFSENGDKNVCLSGTWDPPVGPKIPGKVCYPFEEYIPDYPKSKDSVKDFPPKKEDPSNGPSESLTEIITTSIEGIIASEVGIDLTVALGTAFVFALYNNKADSTAAAAGDLNYFQKNGKKLNLENLLALINALREVYPDKTAQQIVIAINDGANSLSPKLVIPDVPFAQAMAASYQAGWLTAGYVANQLLILFPALQPKDLFSILNIGKYTANEVIPVLGFNYQSGSNIVLDVRTVIQITSDTYNLDEIASGVFNTGYGASEVLKGLMDKYPENLTDMKSQISVLLKAGFSEQSIIEALVFMGNECDSKDLMNAFIASNNFYINEPTSMLGYLKNSPYYGQETLIALFHIFVDEFNTMGSFVANVQNNYNTKETSLALHIIFGNDSAVYNVTKLIKALVSGNKDISPSEAIIGIASVGFGPLDAGTQYTSTFSGIWEQSANDFAKVLASSYGAVSVLQIAKLYFSKAVSTADLACDVLKSSGFDKGDVNKALLAYGFVPSDVNTVLTKYFG